MICEVHGEVKYSSLFKGCKACAIEAVKYKPIRTSRLLTLPEVIKQFVATHGNTYDYSESVYEGNHTKLTIICKKHGRFEQAPANHKGGQGCPVCRYEKSAKATAAKLVKPLDILLEEYITIYGGKYDYSLVAKDYKNNKSMITVICTHHGRFRVRADAHKNNECNECAIGNRAATFSERYTTTVPDLIAKFKIKHGTTYDYSLVTDGHSQAYSTFICPKHGKFEQRNGIHQRGHGCPGCGESLYMDKPTLLYYLKIEHKGMVGYKIGITASSIKIRYKDELRAGVKITTLKTWQYDLGQPAWNREQELLAEFKEFKHSQGHKIVCSGYTELFDRDVLNLDKEITDV